MLSRHKLFQTMMPYQTQTYSTLKTHHQVVPKVKNKHGVEVDNVMQTCYGALKITDLVGVRYGSQISLSKGWAHILYPTPELWTVTLPHRTQILYTPDISMVIMQLEVIPGSIVCEAGTGSGSLSHAFLRAVGPSGHLYTFDFHKERAQIVQEEFRSHGYTDSVTVAHRDVCVDGFGIEAKADAVFLDLPKPWDALPHALKTMKSSGGRICSFSPCIEQVQRTAEIMEKMGLQEITTLECLLREFQIRTITIPSIDVPSQKYGNKREDGEEERKSTDKKIKLDKKLEVDDKKIQEEEHSMNEDGEQVIENKSREIERIKLNDEESEEEEVNGIQKGNENDRKGDTEKKVEKENKTTFKTAVPLLKMPGHTGFLTFATLPPSI
ncbi:tRNA methyltransferase 61 isoform X2 [Oratosquilla oratoria]|uniref:tRNA methyltransferase 61 isoform X2 n=1 Tax=Oratosquilla oratoria TaxID=337810 RepID=UPI003F758F6F